ncbi:MAG TPA: nucleotide exchange factor GrpE [Anaerohalosphaeraceae bacterium]|jgi:molecular chaperone GrpE|nr:nucleotide exchange factor GrpE [Anaerohalosphaeraceae bacterium]HQG04900.1 nucleotide exchange factor GrpE [Anaerohalosphaeraceae bacterium]HQI07435.1 nucleotide exchange factor GrpE [Anaerohalosphaeraceae bacterium]HQJ67665.1 nucleotide exchange factor GrpE [Anaerohalosphaeraceae bacterium]
MTQKKKEEKDELEKKIEEMAKELEQLQEKCKALEEEKQKLFEQFQRLGADYANYQKRTARQISDAVAQEKRKVLRAWLSSLDNLEHALASVTSETGPGALPKVLEGMQLVYDHMLATLKGQGVQKMEPLGKPFEPEMHEALMKRTQEGQKDNVVLEVHQSGYMLGDDVLRPAKVVVNKLPAEGEISEGSEDSVQTENRPMGSSESDEDQGREEL